MFDIIQIKKYWEKIESQKKPPTFVKKINLIYFDDLKKKINKKNEFYLKI